MTSLNIHRSYQRVPAKSKSKDQAILLKHDKQSDTSTFCVTNEMKNDKKKLIINTRSKKTICRAVEMV